ncbi:LysR family transcriptional regulator [Rhodoferax antarcticus]|uniref:Transcriptional regulator, LysR family n=1 Tax=Rhodoferax antarcticus ANT.BR TaxID=1111071 RepID=A0A1Q8YH94_9BURK|nr:LysR family transcriptional regulator [Rhodoferax antarcticus]APW45133.1 LysR family transcriptional regulator [Rhodoferax antarcticus]MCW2313560.1 LysR family transcriptional activator of nhaA [Rhodoferax antarcticus]OLP07366.1 transcriptional regulator, LysR family [Rhodoferax antarcticus ANT.BR]
MSQSFNYRHLYYFWIVAKEGGMARAAERLDMALPTISTQVRELEKSLGVSLLKAQGRNLVLTEAGVATMREADQIFALGEGLPQRVREAVSGARIRFNVGISDGIAKLAVHRLLAPVLGEPKLRLLCHEGEFEQLLAELALHKLDAMLSDRPAPAKSELHITSQLLSSSQIAWYAPKNWADAARNNYPHSLAAVPLLLPTRHSAVRLRIDHWFERERIQPMVVGEFEDSALLMTFGAAGMGVFPATESINDELLETHKLDNIAVCSEVQEEFHLIFTARKVLHPLLLRLLG